MWVSGSVDSSTLVSADMAILLLRPQSYKGIWAVIPETNVRQLEQFNVEERDRVS